jgi:CrcB protein
VTVLWVFLGAMAGAPLRYLTDRAVQSRHDSVFPWGTLTVNVVGCLILGGLAGAGHALSGPVLAVLGTGFCGGLTTYSTFSYETLRLLEARARLLAGANVLLTLVLGLAAGAAGWAAGTSLV